MDRGNKCGQLPFGRGQMLCHRFHFLISHADALVAHKGPRGQVRLVGTAVSIGHRSHPTRPIPFASRMVHFVNASPNMGRPLFDCSCVASSSITSQYSTRTPSLTGKMSAAIRSVGWPKPKKRPCTIAKFFSPTVSFDSYFSPRNECNLSFQVLRHHFSPIALVSLFADPVAYVGRAVEQCDPL